MPVYEDEHALEDLQLSEVWVALYWGWRKDSQRCCQAHRENAGVELSSSIFFVFKGKESLSQIIEYNK